MKSIFLFTVFFLCQFSLKAQLVRSSLSSPYPALHAYSTQFADAFCFRSNSAALAGTRHFSAGIFSERRFLLQDLSSYSLAAALPTATGNFGFQGNYFGGQLYHESSLGLGYGRNLGSRIAIGMQVHYLSMSAAGYGNSSALTFDVGTLWHLTDAVQAGMHVYNPVGMKMGRKGEEKIPAIYSAGLGYDVSPEFFIGAEVQKSEDQPVNVIAGLQYVFTDKLIARGGLQSAGSVYYLGVGVLFKILRLDLTSSFHPYLGVTPGLLLMYSPQ